MARKSLPFKHMSPSLLALVRQVRNLLQALGGRQTFMPRARLVTARSHPLLAGLGAAIPGGSVQAVPRLAGDMASLRIPLLALAAPQLPLPGLPAQTLPAAATLPMPAYVPPLASAPAPPLFERLTMPLPAAPPAPATGDTWHLHLAAPLDEDSVRNDLIPLLDRLRETG